MVAMEKVAVDRQLYESDRLDSDEFAVSQAAGLLELERISDAQKLANVCENVARLVLQLNECDPFDAFNTTSAQNSGVKLPTSRTFTVDPTVDTRSEFEKMIDKNMFDNLPPAKPDDYIPSIKEFFQNNKTIQSAIRFIKAPFRSFRRNS